MGMGLEEEGLALELGLSSTPPEGKPKKSAAAGAALVREHEPSLALTLSGETYDLFPPVRSDERKGKSIDLYRQDSGASSFSSVKRERAINGGDEAEETERVSSRGSDEDDDGSNARKKLRLSKAQSALLEESFKQHSTLNPIQKQDLSRELKLTPRQVEVWFQNRRARTKLKQTEVDCDFLKKLCESLTDENRRLQKELQELKAIHSAQPLYMQIPAATLTMCPSCERIASASAPAVVPETPAKSSLIMAAAAAAAAAPKPNLFNPSVNSLLINH